MRLCAALAPFALFALSLTPACGGAQKASAPHWSAQKREENRPLANGAVIPKPGPNGSVYVKPRNAKVIYAKGAPGGRCKVR